MLHFAPGVSVRFFSSELSDTLTRASVWSLSVRIDVTVVAIRDLADSQGTPRPFSLAVDLVVASTARADEDALGFHLCRFLGGRADIAIDDGVLRVVFAAPATSAGRPAAT